MCLCPGRKIVVAVALFFFILIILAPQVQAEEKLEEMLDLEEVENLWDELEREVGDFLPSLNWRDVVDWLKNKEEPFSISQLIQGIWRYFWQEVLININLLGKLLVLAVIAALLKNLQRAFGSENLTVISQSIIFLILISIALHSFNIAVSVGREAIGGMVDIILALLPLLLVLLSSLGSLASAALFHPLVVFTVHFFAAVVKDVAFPLIYFSTILSFINYLTTSYPVNRLANLFRDLSIWIMGLCLSVFIGITAIQGVAGAVADAVTLRTAKFATGALVPVVGGMLADALESVMGVSIVLKNGIGIFGLIMLFLYTIFPLVKIFTIMLIYKAAAAIAQPLGDTELCEGLNTLGNCLTLVVAAVAVVCVMFIIAVSIIIGAGNAVVMFR